MDTNKYIPTVEAIEKASGVLEEILEPTPFQKNQNLSDIYGANIYLKREDLQMVRSYKIRGAYNKIRTIEPELLKCVEDVNEAVRHISAHSTGHSEAIVTRDADAEAIFTACVDSAAVYVNASTRFTDGGEFGLGCEMGISTQKLHARGPMGLRELTTYKYVVHGNGHIR